MFSSCRVLLILASSGFISPSVNSKLTFFFPLRIHPSSFGYSTLGLSTKDSFTFFFFFFCQEVDLLLDLDQ